MENKLIYGVNDSPKTIKELLLYSIQQVLSILTATVLISSICGTDISAGLVGAGFATLVFHCYTKNSVPLFFSNSGSTCAAVITSISLTGDYSGVIIGGITVLVMNCISGVLCKKLGTKWVNKLLPPIVSGTIVLVIGLNLASFCPVYAQVNGEYNLIGVIISIVTMLITVITMHYAKGKLSTLPFLIGAIGGYIICIVVTLFGIAPLVDFGVFKNMNLFIIPKFAFMNSAKILSIDIQTLLTIIITYAAVNLANLGEHISDVLAVSSVVGEDYTDKLSDTFIGDGLADVVGCVIGGQPTTTYSESLSTISVSKVASIKVIKTAAIITILLGFFGPFNALIVSMPSCIFAGISLVAYGCIAFSGVRTLHSIKLTGKNMIIFAVMSTVGVSGIPLILGKFTLEKIALSMIIGLILNLILKEK